jgi:hypothetical protein
LTCAVLVVSPKTFDQLLSTFEDHPVFAYRGTIPQLRVDYQLAIALYRFGHEGSGVSNEGIAQWAGVCSGTVSKVTRRVISAILSVHDKVIRWPTEEEKEEASAWVESVSCTAWKGGFCMVDGTLIPLYEKPALFGEGYFDRKSNYSLNLQV